MTDNITYSRSQFIRGGLKGVGVVLLLLFLYWWVIFSENKQDAGWLLFGYIIASPVIAVVSFILGAAISRIIHNRKNNDIVAQNRFVNKSFYVAGILFLFQVIVGFSDEHRRNVFFNPQNFSGPSQNIVMRFLDVIMNEYLGLVGLLMVVFLVIGIVGLLFRKRAR